MSAEKPSGRGRGNYNANNNNTYYGDRRGNATNGQPNGSYPSNQSSGRGGGGGHINPTHGNNTALPPQGEFKSRRSDNKTPPPQAQGHSGGDYNNNRRSNHHTPNAHHGTGTDDASMLPPPAHHLRNNNNAGGGGYGGGYNNRHSNANTPQPQHRGGRRDDGYGADETGGGRGHHNAGGHPHGYSPSHHQGTNTGGSTLTHTHTSNNMTGTNPSSSSAAANNNTGGGGSGASTDLVLSVMDMGLDFRSYQSFSDPQTGRPVVGNIVTFAAEKVPDVFQPTVGLLVTMLHMYFVSRVHETARTWIRAYETVQRLYLEAAQTTHTNNSLSASFSSQPNMQSPSKGGNYHSGGNAAPDHATQQTRDSSIRQAEDAIRIISQHENSQSHHPDRGLCERLLVLLDQQSGSRGGGGQAPSQRRVPPAPKATFCNLHLSDHKCHQDFSCNQVHLHQVGSIKHRVEYHARLVQCLLANKLTPEMVDQRLRDSLFYAKYGNKVTIRCSDGTWVPFFKTLYTPSRLDMALRKTSTGNVKLQDPNARQQGTKPMDLSSPEAEVKAYLDDGCREVYAAMEQKNQQKRDAVTPPLKAKGADGGNVTITNAASEPNVLQILTTSMATKATTSTPPKSAAPQTHSLLDTPNTTPSKPFQLQMTPPSMIPWASSLATDDKDESLVREYVRLTGISEHEHRANEALLNALQVNGSSSTPVTPESFTPLLNEVQMRRFQSEMSLDGESFRV